MEKRQFFLPESMGKILWLLLLVVVLMVGWRLPLVVLVAILLLFLLAPLWQEFRPRSPLDERQVYISHFSSHIAFYVFLALLLFILIYRYAPQHRNPESHWYALLLIPLVVKFMVSLFQNYGARAAARGIGFFFGFSWLLFVLLSHGFRLAFFIEALPFVLIVGAAWFCGKQPLLSGLFFILVAVGLAIFFHGWSRFDIFIRLLMFTLLPLPILVSGVALVFASRQKEVS